MQQASRKRDRLYAAHTLGPRCRVRTDVTCGRWQPRPLTKNPRPESAEDIGAQQPESSPWVAGRSLTDEERESKTAKIPPIPPAKNRFAPTARLSLLPYCGNEKKGLPAGRGIAVSALGGSRKLPNLTNRPARFSSRSAERPITTGVGPESPDRIGRKAEHRHHWYGCRRWCRN